MYRKNNIEDTIHNAYTIDDMVRVYSDLRVLSDRAGAGQLTGDAYSDEWRRLNSERDTIARALSPDELKEAYERARFS